MAKGKALKGQYFLFTNAGEQKQWCAPTELPTLDGVKELAFDTEATGKNKRSDHPIGLSFCTEDGRKAYLPWGHAGGNIDPEKVKRWAKGELRNKKLIGLNIGFDAEVMLRWGVDLEAQGCQLYDVAHGAALLNENRYAGFNLQDLGKEYCGRPKLDEALEKDRMPDYHASMVGAYAEEDAQLSWDVYQAQRPLIEKDNLGKVDDLESKLIWANNHMERSGARIDLDKFKQFKTNLINEVGNLCMDIWKKSGVKLEANKNGSWDRLYDYLGLERSESYKNEIIEATFKKHPTELLKDAFRVRRLLSLKSKYFEKMPKHLAGDILFYSLYQLRAGEEEQGTVVGRYSATNFPIQTCFKVENQIKKYGEGYIIRELMIPDDGFDFFAADGSQLQFRLFAHLSQDKDLIRAYHEGYERWLQGGKDVDFHQMVADLFSLRRQDAKTNNFAKVMGLGRPHLAHNLGLGCDCQPESYWWWTGNSETFKKFEDNDNHAADCPARKANDLVDEYEAKFPAAKKTMDYVTKFGKTQGYVPSLLGRRRRCGEYEVRNGIRQKTRFYKLLASWLQMSEADIVKSKILRLYNERNNIGIHKMRMPVHDEATGDIEKSAKARERLREVLRIQEIPCRVPISWNDEYGANWRACSGK